MTEHIYYVNDHDQPTGETEEKLAAHHQNTRLHAAFSCYVFNAEGKFLATQRAFGKKVWPGVWTNTACGHPMPNESREDALKRRLQYELGMKVTDVNVALPKYTYKTPPYKGIIEHEYCPVYVAIAASEPVPNPVEVAQYKWLKWSQFVQAAKEDENGKGARAWMLELPHDEYAALGVWSWWCKDQLKQLQNLEIIKKYSQTSD